MHIMTVEDPNHVKMSIIKHTMNAHYGLKNLTIKNNHCDCP